jgi:hypothetical protein
MNESQKPTNGNNLGVFAAWREAEQIYFSRRGALVKQVKKRFNWAGRDAKTH